VDWHRRQGGCLSLAEAAKHPGERHGDDHADHEMAQQRHGCGCNAEDVEQDRFGDIGRSGDKVQQSKNRNQAGTGRGRTGNGHSENGAG
jgi:hypothetical protein